MALKITAKTQSAKDKLEKLEKGLDKKVTDPIMEKVAYKTYARLVSKTPKGFTGQTRRNWGVFKRPQGGYLVTNRPGKVMLFLEKGTKAHGPKTAKALYIPLNRKAALSGWNDSLVPGVDYIVRKSVKGIKAMKIVAKERPITAMERNKAMRKHIKNLLSG